MTTQAKVALVKKQSMADEPVWEDREIRFDLPGVELQPRPGEKVLVTYTAVEDTKGNAGDRGILLVTNLRTVWHSLSAPRVSLSIGYNCVIHVATKIVNSKLMGVSKALYMLTRTPNARYEFIFTNIDTTDPLGHFTSVIAVYRSYNMTRLYRELKLRGALFRGVGGALRVLNRERILNTFRGVWNLASDQGSLGSLIVTNIRVVWYAEMNDNFNISLPFLQIKQVRVRSSRFGEALVLATQDGPGGGGYVLGFRVDPIERLQSVAQELSALHKAFSREPDFGVEFDVNNAKQANTAQPTQKVEREVQEIDDRPNEMSDALVTYYAASSVGGQDEDEEVTATFCPELGLAVETLKEGFTIKSLWEVLTTDH